MVPLFKPIMTGFNDAFHRLKKVNYVVVTHKTKKICDIVLVPSDACLVHSSGRLPSNLKTVHDTENNVVIAEWAVASAASTSVIDEALLAPAEDITALIGPPLPPEERSVEFDSWSFGCSLDFDDCEYSMGFFKRYISCQLYFLKSIK